MSLVDAQVVYRDLELKKLKPVYFFFGDEPFLLNQIPERFKFAVLEENTFDFNYSLFYAADADSKDRKSVV